MGYEHEYRLDALISYLPRQRSIHHRALVRSGNAQHAGARELGDSVRRVRCCTDTLRLTHKGDIYGSRIGCAGTNHDLCITVFRRRQASRRVATVRVGSMVGVCFRNGVCDPPGAAHESREGWLTKVSWDCRTGEYQIYRYPKPDVTRFTA